MQRLIADIQKDISAHTARSSWEKGVKSYAEELFERFVENRHLSDNARIGKITDTDLLGGADDWRHYSYGGCAEVYDADICARLCSKAEKRKTRDGELKLNGEDWLSVQARALQQAAQIVISVVNRRG